MLPDYLWRPVPHSREVFSIRSLSGGQRSEGETTMKTIGLIGGMSWESSIEYYRIINETTKAKLGGLHSAKSLMYSVDFAEVEVLQHQGRWAEAARMMIDAAKSLENGGADFIVLCTNTMHKAADDIQAGVGIPFLHIADATAQRIRDSGIRKVGLLGTRFTMEEEFYKGRLANKFGLSVYVPDARERETVHRVIYDELVVGRIERRSKARYAGIIEKMVDRGAEGVVLGCTEIGLLVHQEDSRVPLFDTTRIHAEAAVEYALK
jgi:aspartate racemase